MAEADRDRVLEWRNQPKVRENMYTSHEISEQEHERWFAAASRDPSKRLFVCVDESDVGVGVVTFSEINTSSGTATWAFYTGSTAPRGVGSAMEVLALDHAFEDLGLEKLNCEVLSFNMPVVEFHRKFGFRVEGIFRDHYARDGKRYDVWRLAHFRGAWLEKVRPTVLGDGRSSKFRPGAVHRERRHVTRDLIRRFAEMSDDFNSAQLDGTIARAAGFGKVTIAQGMLIGSELSRIFNTVFPGPGTVYVSQSLQFLKPMYAEAELEYQLRIASKIGERAIVSVVVSGPNNEIFITGDAEVVLPSEESA